MNAPTDADRFLMLLRDNPTLLYPAPPGASGADLDHRAQVEQHDCLRCGRPADCAFIATTRVGPRWVDLCVADAAWLRRNATPAPPMPYPVAE